MDVYDAVKRAAADAGLSLSQVSRNLGRPSNYIVNGASRGSVPSASIAAAMLEACGWRLVAVPAGSVPADGLPIDAPAPDGDAERRALERKRDRLRAELAATEERLG
ncbi:MAG: hypothetical protein HFJ72_08415 [Adlercreutzia sp.]|nr:hypothetical protein [Adlercreutzia sp.]